MRSAAGIEQLGQELVVAPLVPGEVEDPLERRRLPEFRLAGVTSGNVRVERPILFPREQPQPGLLHPVSDVFTSQGIPPFEAGARAAPAEAGVRGRGRT